jgi:hypothetical protein
VKKNGAKTNGEEQKRSELTKNESEKTPADESKKNGIGITEMIEVEIVAIIETIETGIEIEIAETTGTIEIAETADNM